MQDTLKNYACAALLLAATPFCGGAQQIDLALNLLYNDPTDETSGGAWQVIGRSDNFGIESVAFTLSGINPAVTRDAPFGTVNGSDGAGFTNFLTASNSLGVQVIVGHSLPTEVGAQIGEFYGFGTLENGSPLFSGTPTGANTVPGSPDITTLTGLGGQALPWASGDTFGDPDFDVFAQIASGTFAPGDTPEFNASSPLLGTVFTSIGAVDSPGATSLSGDTVVSLLETRTNLIDLPDYNDDGLVNAADYTVFRDTFGATVPLGEGADGDGSGQIDLPDFDAWQAGFGLGVTPAAIAAVAAVPEPASGTLFLLAALAIGCRRNRFGSKTAGIRGVIAQPEKT